jgi:hypothetical protein
MEEPKVLNVAIGDFHINEAKDGQPIVSLACMLHDSVTINDDDPDSCYTDLDDGDRRCVFRLSGTIEVEDEIEAMLSTRSSPALA